MGGRPPRPPSNFIVGIQRPKLRPAMEEVLESLVPIADPVETVEFESSDALVDVDAVEAVDAAVGGAAHALPSADVVISAVELVAAMAEPVDEEVVAPVPEAAPSAGDGPALPATSLVVKLVKPCAAMTSATLLPVASNGVWRDCAERAFSPSDPITPGSTNGTIPRISGF